MVEPKVVCIRAALSGPKHKRALYVLCSGLFKFRSAVDVVSSSSSSQSGQRAKQRKAKSETRRGERGECRAEKGEAEPRERERERTLAAIATAGCSSRPHNQKSHRRSVARLRGCCWRSQPQPQPSAACALQTALHTRWCYARALAPSPADKSRSLFRRTSPRLGRYRVQHPAANWRR